MTMTVYGNRLSQPCRAVEILLRELGVPYAWHEVDLPGGETHADWFAEQINAFETVPALVVSTDDKQADDVSIGESHAIMRYACCVADSRATANAWYPGDSDPLRAARIDQWLAWHHNNVRRYDMFHPIMNLHLTLPMLKREIQQTVLEPLQARLRVALRMLEARFGRLGAGARNPPTLCGDSAPTIADLALGCELYQLVAIGYRFSNYPLVERWLDSLSERQHFRQVSSVICDQGRTIRQQSGEYLSLTTAFA